MTEILFYVFSAVAVGSAIAMVTRSNPVASLLFMVATLASLAGIYVLFEAHFLAAVQIIVYAGAIMVLFLFVIMLLNLGHDYQRDLKGGVWAILSFIVAGAMAGILARQFGGTGGQPHLRALPGSREDRRPPGRAGCRGNHRPPPLHGLRGGLRVGGNPSPGGYRRGRGPGEAEGVTKHVD
jgi:hypothetical protein